MATVTPDDGTRLSYDVDDFTDPWRAAEPVVLVHGFGKNRKFWYPWVPALASHYRVIRVDLRGHGESSLPMDILGIKPDYYRGGTDDAITAIKDKAIIRYVKTQAGTTLDASTMDLMAFTKIRLIGYTDEHIKRIAEKRPCDVWMNLKEDELYKGAPALKAIAVVVGTGTLKGNIPDDLAYKMVKAINEKGADEIAASIKYMKGWQFAQRTAELANLPLHPGAVKYLQEQGVKLRPELIPPEMK